MGRRYNNPLTNPVNYASQQLHTGPPTTYATAQRLLPGYDYVIVGAGAAGCVLASKLSEDPFTSVLLLEAGGTNTSIFESKVPLMFPKLFHSKHDWDYITAEQPGLAHRRLYWPRGCMIGGSTSMNAMVYHHCSKSDFNEWATKYGCDGWAYDDIAPYFRCMEKHTPNPLRPAIDMAHRGSDGLWQTGYAHLSEIVDKGFIPACKDAGIAANPDINTSGGTIGVTRTQTFIDSKGQRSSMATAFLTSDIMRRPNLYVATGAHVSKVLYDRLTSENEPTAIGVEFQSKRDGPRFQVHAKQEVLLCGGAINTPQTLMLSGIGHAAELGRHGIRVVRENDAVGHNLKDHLCSTGIMCKTRPGMSLDYLADTLKALPALVRWLLTGTGPLTSNAVEAVAFIRSVEYKDGVSEAHAPKDYGSGKVGPDLEILGAPLAYIHHGEELITEGSSAFSLAPCGLRPQSSGTITLQSANPFDKAIIDPKYLSDAESNDQNVLLAGLRVCLTIARSPALAKFLEKVPVDDDPTSYWWPYSSSDVTAITDEQLIRFLKEKAFTLYHPVGSARMGPDPATSVVDLECRVHGVGRLRVMDASVFPEQVSGHLTAPIGAMAYKLSEMITGERAISITREGARE